jgi:hypothetical protein
VEAAVLSEIDPSLNVSNAEYCWVPVTGIEAVAGVTTNDTGIAPFTVNMAVAVWPLYLAVMVDVPGLTAVATPIVGLVFEIVATPEPVRSGEVQAETAVLSMLVPSLNVSIAVNCWVPVTGIEAVAGITSNFVDVAAFTVKILVPAAAPV